MKTFIIAIFLILITNNVLANVIDELKTIDDVNTFLITRVNPKWKGTAFLSNNSKDRFLKMDIDNNGLTDLIIEGQYLLAVTDKGNGSYDTHFIDRGAFMLGKFKLSNIIYKDRLPLFLIQKKSRGFRDTIVNGEIDTLAFKYGDFFEYNPKPDNLKIEKIIYSTSRCFGTCPVYEITIKPDKTITYNAIEYNDKKGKFRSVIDSDSYGKIITTINYIDLRNLNEAYKVNWTDDQTATLEIIYNNGISKKISDYGMIGTFGLANLYRQLAALRFTQIWK